MSDVLEELGTGVLREYIYFMTGKHLGGGMSRQVFDHPTDPHKVIKIENSAKNFQNVQEWHIWRDFQTIKSIAKWLAPCHSISHSGTFLIMEKARDLVPSECPKKVPFFITDHHIGNFGMLDERVVCRDYGTARIAMNDKKIPYYNQWELKA